MIPRKQRLKAEGGGGGVKRYTSTFSLTSALDGDGWLTPRPGRFIHGKETVDCTEGWVGALGPGLDGCRKSRLYRDSIPGPPRP